MVIDSHTHAWGPDIEEHPWETQPIISAVQQLPVETVYTADELLNDMDDVGIDEAVVIGLPVTDWLDNWYIKKLSRDTERLYGIALLDPFPDGAATDLRQLMDIERLVGIRLATVFPREKMYEVNPSETVQNQWLRDAIDEEEFWEACEETDAAVTLLTHFKQLDQVQELVNTYPDLTYVIDHIGRAGAAVPIDDTDFVKFADITDNKNVLIKASALPALSDLDFPHLDMEEKIRWLLDEVGREQAAWGSDFPFVSSVSDYKGALNCLDYMESVSQQDQRWLTEKSFKRHLGL